MLKLSDIQHNIASYEPNKAWASYLKFAATGLPFWEQAITKMAELTGVDATKAEAHRQVARSAFSLLDDWYFERAPIVKARRNEIDSAISFIRNAAIRHEVATIPAAASARHLAGVMRVLLHLATHNYPAAQYPQHMTNGLLWLAAAKTVFPLDLSDTVAEFAQPGKSPVDNIDHLTPILERAAAAFHIEEALVQLNQALQDFWAHFEEPQAWNLPQAAWKPQATSLLAEFHGQSVRGFHERG